MKQVAALVALILITVSFTGCLGIVMSGGSDLERVQGLEADPSTVHISLRWEEVEGADAYQIYRDGEELAITQGNEYDDISPDRGMEYEYQVCAMKMMGTSARVTGEMSEPVMAYLEALTFNLNGFTDFVEDSGSVIKGMLEELREAADDMKMNRTADLCEDLSSLCHDYTSMALRFDLPSEEAKDEYLMALQDFGSAADSFKYGVDHMNMESFEEGQELISSGIDHLEQARGML